MCKRSHAPTLWPIVSKSLRAAVTAMDTDPAAEEGGSCRCGSWLCLAWRCSSQPAWKNLTPGGPYTTTSSSCPFTPTMVRLRGGAGPGRWVGGACCCLDAGGRVAPCSKMRSSGGGGHVSDSPALLHLDKGRPQKHALHALLCSAPLRSAWVFPGTWS